MVGGQEVRRSGRQRGRKGTLSGRIRLLRGSRPPPRRWDMQTQHRGRGVGVGGMRMAAGFMFMRKGKAEGSNGTMTKHNWELSLS